jgi:hypothetical protein
MPTDQQSVSRIYAGSRRRTGNDHSSNAAVDIVSYRQIATALKSVTHEAERSPNLGVVQSLIVLLVGCGLCPSSNVALGHPDRSRPSPHRG